MKKILVIALLGLLIGSNCFAVAVKRESYEDNNSGSYALGSYGNTRIGQSWKTETEYKITSVKLILSRYQGALTGNFTVNINLADTNHLATGTVLATGNYNSANIDTNYPAIGNWYEISLGSGINLEKTKEYVISIDYAGGDGTHQVAWNCDTGENQYATGTQQKSVDAGSSWTNENQDCLFQIYGEDIEEEPTGTSSTISIFQNWFGEAGAYILWTLALIFVILILKPTISIIKQVIFFYRDKDKF